MILFHSSLFINLIVFILKRKLCLCLSEKSSGGTAGFIFTSPYPQVSGTGEAPPYY